MLGQAMFSLIVFATIVDATAPDGACGASSTAVASLSQQMAQTNGVNSLMTCAQYASDQASIIQGFQGAYASFNSESK